MSDSSQCAVSSGFIQERETLKIRDLAHVLVYSCSYNKEQYSDDLFAELDVICPSHLSKAVKKRKAEYLAGRYCASLALKNFGETNFDIKTGKHRNPIWPECFCGSITHTESKAYAAVARSSECNHLGIDYEKIVEANTAENIHSLIINGYELEYLMDSFSDMPLALTFAFSAKESLFKALYPSVGQYFDFSAASILKLSIKEQTFELKLNQTLSENFKKDRCFHGFFSIELGHVLTLIAD